MRRPRKKRQWLREVGIALGLGALLVAGTQGLQGVFGSKDEEVNESNLQSAQSESSDPAGALDAFDELLDAPFDASALEGLNEEDQKTLEAVLGDAASVETTLVEKDVARAAAGLLETYEQAQAHLAFASYLDALGRVWGCVVQGGDWVEACVVHQDAESEKSLVKVVRFDRGEWTEALS